MKLTKNKLERLAILVEKCAEVQRLIMKTIRHGEMGSHSDSPSVPNIEILSEEVGDLFLSLAWCMDSKDIDAEIVEDAFKKRHNTINKYLHYNNFDKDYDLE